MRRVRRISSQSEVVWFCICRQALDSWWCDLYSPQRKCSSPSCGSNCFGVSESLPPLHNKSLCVGSLCWSDISIYFFTALGLLNLSRAVNHCCKKSSALVTNTRLKLIHKCSCHFRVIRVFIHFILIVIAGLSLSLISLPRALTDRAVLSV